ncbi:MAG: tRNA (pseudouridine(54)-N(1))-methyltransferase TrmY [Nanoarchaeota archaeon]|nr:tRNA (pseudouridine(54)-N(1))-methyltransferase TrmY [Nanoarchaeota archaeon]
MREFIYYSRNAVTAGHMIKDNLMQAGRMDIVCNVIISVFFISNAMREDVKLHLIFDGPPSAPRHLVLESNRDLSISKKNVAGLIKKLLYKSPDKEGLLEILPGASIEKKSFEKLVKELDKEGKDVLLLSGRGEDIRKIDLNKKPVFIIGDHEGFPKDKTKFLKKIDQVSVGPKVLFASQVITILHNELDRNL